MGEIYFKAQLLDDVVLSQRTATVGDHKSLDYIPGSVFLGIAASKLYSNVGKEKAWKLFHTSGIRFCNAYPVINGKRTLPMPLALHSEKVPRTGKENEILNFVYPEVKDDKIQYRQNRNGYVSVTDDKLSFTIPSKTSRMRTAINVKTGSAAQSQLYGYESLDAGQIFIGKIEWEDSINEIASSIEKLFSSEEIVHAGRSKTASYGRVKISKLTGESNNLQNTMDNGKSFSILAVSDICLRNPFTGSPELQILPSAIGLDDNWKLDKTRTFTRPSVVYQYNSYRKEIEIQKTLISKGSVFTFKSEKELTNEEKQKILSSIKNGIGEARGQGFGEIALFNFDKLLSKSALNQKETLKGPALTENEQKWLDWLTPVYISENVDKKVTNAVNEFVNRCVSIKSFNAFGPEKVFWPGKAQWGNIMDVVRTCSSKKEIFAKLFDCETALIKPKTETRTELHGDIKIKNPDPEWNEESSLHGETLRDWLIEFVKDDSLNDKDMKIALQELTKRCGEKIQEANWLRRV